MEDWASNVGEDSDCRLTMETGADPLPFGPLEEHLQVANGVRTTAMSVLLAALGSTAASTSQARF